MPFFPEKPPILTGRDRDDIANMRDWLFRFHASLDEVIVADTNTNTGYSISTRNDGQQVLRTQGGTPQDIEAVKKNARELKSLIIKSAKNLQRQIDNIEHSTFYIKYADDFAGDYPESMYNAPKESTYYMGVCSSTEATAPTDPAAYSWSRIKGDGGTGLNSATVLLYRRAVSPPAKPQATLTYTFASGRLDLGPANVQGHMARDIDASVTGHMAVSTGIEVEGHMASVTGWTQEIPDSDGRPCWVITATAIATTATDDISPSEWSEVKKLVEDGKAGKEGQAGRDGADGSDGRDGRDGSDGRGIAQTTIRYGTSQSAATEPESWSENVPTSLVKGTWLWVKTAITYTDGDDSTTYSKSYVGTDGEDGKGVVIQSATKTGDTTTVVLVDTSGTPTTLTIVDGSDGENGTPGTDGLSGYVHTAWANSADGSVDFSTTISAGKEYLGVYTDNTAEDSTYYGAYSWSLIKGTDGQDGAPGAAGTNGYNTALVYLYTRADEAPTIGWTTAIKYTFSTGKLASEPSGWSQTIPAADGSKKLYVTAASARSRSTTVNIAATAWATPVLLAENGQDGQQGIQGPPGADGQTTYLHIKYSDDGETFTVNPDTGVADGETVGAYIGTLTDYTETDSMTFSDYTWHRFADDEELQAAIQETGLAAQEYCDRKVESLSSMYVAQSEYGTFKEEINTTIETTAKNTVESYGYGASIEALDQRTDSIQKYLTAIDGEIRRGIVEDPTTGDYVTGIAISQNLKFTGECGPADQHNPGDGYTYYYIDQHQTFGLYTSTGWQFWIDGYRRGWFNSLDNMLHVANVVVENVLQIGSSWQLRTSLDGTEFEILYVGA